MKTILHPNNLLDESLSTSAEFFHLFKLKQFFTRYARRDGKGIPAFNIFQFLFSLVFMKKSLYAMTKEKSLPWGKDTFYRFFAEARINWRRFLLSVGSHIIRDFFSGLTEDCGDRVFILDDSPYYRNRSCRVDLISRCYDHSNQKFYKGFRMLTLGWSDGRSFLPLAFSLLPSPKEENRLFGPGNHDGRTFGGRMRKEAVKQTPEAALSLLDRALGAGVRAGYLLFDSWFATNPFISSVRRSGLHVIAMAKDFNSLHFLAADGKDSTKKMKLGALYERVRSGLGGKDTLGSAIAEIGGGKGSEEVPLPVKIVFVRSRKKGGKRQWFALISTDVSLTGEEIVRIYGKRWSIEVFFKACKSVLKLAREFQTRSYESLIAHTSIVFLRYMMISCEQRRKMDGRTIESL